MLDNLLTIFYMLGLLAIVIAVNTILGVVIANKKLKFNWKKLWTGLGKAILITICMLLFCLTLELIPNVLGKIGIDVPPELMSVLEMVLMVFTAYKKYALDCIDKFKQILGGE